MRGKARFWRCSRRRSWITPAHAGKSGRSLVLNSLDKDHPRACGEKWTSNDFTVGSQGSPPRMRGKDGNFTAAADHRRITPAHAGKSEGHPHRRRGDHGSPPRMRGKGTPAGAGTPRTRITPAHAGKSSAPARTLSTSGDHPRACGEKDGAHSQSLAYKGSPPRMRGKGWRWWPEQLRRGITPAHAGKRQGKQCEARRDRDHPRACGEKRDPCRSDKTRSGSPPRMRGKDLAAVVGAGRDGITPAHAGKSSCWTTATAGKSDHPRACGEKVASVAQQALGVGSPPRMRGKD